MRWPNLKGFLYPRSAEEALRMLEEGQGKAIPLGGGTSLAASSREGVERLVDISRAGLRYVRAADGVLCIGAATPAGDLARPPEGGGPASRLLAESCAAISSRAIRDAVTVGGNLVQSFPWSHLPLVCLALDARFVLGLGARRRTVEAAAFFAQHPRRLLEPGEMLLEARVPEFEGRAKFARLALVRNDYALVTAVACVETGASGTRVRLAVGGCLALPRRMTEAEDLLSARGFGEETVREAGEKVRAGLRVREDFRAGAEYRAHMAGVLAQDCLSADLKPKEES